MKNRKVISIFLIIFLNLSANPKMLSALGQGESWIRIWDSGNIDYCGGMAIDSLDNIYVVGMIEATERRVFLLKYDKLGNLIWEQSWDNHLICWASAICTDSFDNVYIAGNTKCEGDGESDIFLLKYNSTGNLQWNRTWERHNDDWCSAVTVDSLDNIYAVGSTNGFGGMGHDMLLLKYNSSGGLLLNYTWGDVHDESCRGLTIDSSDNLYICCYSYNWNSNEGNSTLIKYNTSGEFQWNQTWEGGPSLCALDSLGNIIVVSYDLIMKYNNSGIQIWNTTEIGKVEEVEDITLDSQDNIYITGYHVYGCCSDGFCRTCIYMALDNYNASGSLVDDLQCYRIDSEGNSIAFDSLGNLYIAGVTWANNLLTQNIVVLKNPTEYVENDGINDYFIIWILLFGVTCGSLIIIIMIFSKIRKRK